MIEFRPYNYRANRIRVKRDEPLNLAIVSYQNNTTGVDVDMMLTKHEALLLANALMQIVEEMR